MYNYAPVTKVEVIRLNLLIVVSQPQRDINYDGCCGSWIRTNAQRLTGPAYETGEIGHFSIPRY